MGDVGEAAAAAGGGNGAIQEKQATDSGRDEPVEPEVDRELEKDGPVDEIVDLEKDGHVDGIVLVQDKAEGTESALAKLRGLCHVLGINYNRKLLEFGTTIDRERVFESIDFLEITKSDNFSELQETAGDMVKAWKAANTPLKRMSSFAWVLAVRDAPDPDSVTAENHLSTELITKAKKEVLSIQNERSRKMKEKYFAQRTKLTRILSESHLMAADVKFDPNKKVEKEQYQAEKQNLKACIKSAKALLPDRKEMVLRVELVQHAVKQKWSSQYIEALIGDAKKSVAAMRVGAINQAVLFDGRDVDEVLRNLQQACIDNEAAREEQPLNKSAQVKSKTRSGKVFPAPSK